MSLVTMNLVWLGFAAFLIVANAFFVAAEFALVKIRPSQIDELVRKGRPLSKVASWLLHRLDRPGEDGAIGQGQPSREGRSRRLLRGQDRPALVLQGQQELEADRVGSSQADVATLRP